MKKLATLLLLFLCAACCSPGIQPQIVHDVYDSTHGGNNSAGSFSVPCGRNVTVVISSPFPPDYNNPYDHRIELAQNEANNQSATTGAKVGDMLVISNRCCRQILAGDAGRWTYTIQPNTAEQFFYDGVGWWPSSSDREAGYLVGVSK